MENLPSTNGVPSTSNGTRTSCFLDRIWQLRENVSAYDAVYVALAEALGAVLVTGDRRLAGASGLGIRIEPA